MQFDSYIADFSNYPTLQQRVLEVLQALPIHVQNDFVGDPRFQCTIENFEPGKGWSLWMPTPGPPGQESRCVVLRPRLDQATEPFAKYIIAHEFAHAFLNNGGWGEITDAEDAADAVASVRVGRRG